MPEKDPWADDPLQAVFFARVGAEIRKFRTAPETKASLESAAEILGWEKARLSKIELGQQRIGFWEYLELMREIAPPDHPAVILRQHINRLRLPST